MVEPAGGVRLVRPLVGGEAHVAIDAKDRPARIAADLGGEARQSIVHLLHELAHGAEHFLLPRSAMGLEPRSLIVALERAEILQRSRTESSKCAQRPLGNAVSHAAATAATARMRAAAATRCAGSAAAVRRRRSAIVRRRSAAASRRGSRTRRTATLRGHRPTTAARRRGIAARLIARRTLIALRTLRRLRRTILPVAGRIPTSEVRRVHVARFATSAYAMPDPGRRA